MSPYSGGGVIIGGGGSESSKAGGLNEGARRRCMGRGWSGRWIPFAEAAGAEGLP